jgi:hypothetical protein
LSTDTESPRGQSTAELMGGILGDLQHLVDQQFHLIRQEIEIDARRYTRAVVLCAVGVGVWLTAAVMACLGLSQLMHWSTSPASTDPASLPLWACHAVVAGILAPVGGLLLWMGRAEMKLRSYSKGSTAHYVQDALP